VPKKGSIKEKAKSNDKSGPAAKRSSVKQQAKSSSPRKPAAKRSATKREAATRKKTSSPQAKRSGGGNKQASTVGKTKGKKKKNEKR
jgi:hypothetical protein